MDEYIKKMKNYSVIKRWNLAICSNMDVPWGYYAKWNKSGGERQIIYDFNHMWNISKVKINKTNKNKQIDTEDRLVATRGERRLVRKQNG